MKNILLIALNAVYFIGCEAVTDTYPTLEDAKKDRLFERGWLPDILPPSSTKITTSNDLDINTSAGEFYFKPRERAVLLKHFDVDPNQQDIQSYNDYKFNKGGDNWIFTCKLSAGYCKYKLLYKSGS